MSDERRWPQIDGVDEHAMPCEGCGELVRIGSTDVATTIEAWAEGVVRVWCSDCWVVTP